MEGIATQKSALRKSLLSTKLAMSDDEWSEKSTAVHHNLLQLDEIKLAERVHSYISINKRKELNTLPLVEYFLEEGKEVVVPIISEDKKTLDHSFIHGLGDLEENNWGVLEPKRIIPADASTFDIIIVPMVGADKLKNRIGYGKGFYDRFLSKQKALKIGLCFSEAVIDELPVEPFDIPLDIIVTEEEVIR